MALFDNHKKCARCHDKGVGDDPCVKKQDCQIYKAFTPAQVQQLATTTYKARKERGEQKKSEVSDATSTLVDPSDVTLLGRVSTDKTSSVESTPKRRHSSKPTSDDLKSLDDKWSERFSRLEALLLNKSFAMPVRPVNTSTVVTREHPFFDPGASTSVMSTGLVTESTGSSLVQTTGEAAQLTATQPPLGVPGTTTVGDVSKSATRPVQGPGTSDLATQTLKAPGAETATQPLQAPGAGTATQPPQAPGAGPEVLPTGNESTQPNKSLPGVRPNELVNVTVRQRLMGNRLHQLVFTSRMNYRKTQLTRISLKMPTTGRLSDWSDASWAGIRSMTTRVHLPPSGSRAKPTGKVSVKLPVDEWLCRKFERLNVTVAEGYPSRNSETGGLLQDQFVKTPRSSKWYAMHSGKKDSACTSVCDWSPEPAKLNSTFTRVARHSLPSAPASRTFSQDTLRRWEKVFREQPVICNQTAGLSRCFTKVEDSMVTQLKSLRVDTGKGKAAERTQQAVEELEYLVTFNRSISQAMQRTMQDLSEGVFISMANLTLARRDSYLEFIRGGVKPDTLTALRTAPVHLRSLFPDSLLVKAEDEISRSEERRSSGSAHR